MVTYIEAFSAPMKNTGVIRLYNSDAFEGMRKACQLTARALDELYPLVQPGVSTDALDRFAQATRTRLRIAARADSPVRCVFRRGRFDSCARSPQQHAAGR